MSGRQRESEQGSAAMVKSRHLFAGYFDRTPEERPKNAGIAGRSGQRAVVAVILVQATGQQRSYVETRNLHFLI